MQTSRETCVCDACETISYANLYERYGAPFAKLARDDGYANLINHAGMIKRCPSCAQGYAEAIAKYGKDPMMIELELTLASVPPRPANAPTLSEAMDVVRALEAFKPKPTPPEKN